MTEREKLIEIFKEIDYLPYPNTPETMKANLANQFTDYALDIIIDEMIKNNIIVLPCKVGDTVYELTKDCFSCNYLKDYSYGYICGRDYNRRLFDTCYEKDCKCKISEIFFTYNLIPYIGKHVFLTKEEAEQAIEALKGDNE